MTQKGWGKVWENIKWKGSAMERPEFKLSYVVFIYCYFLYNSFQLLSLKNLFNYKQIQIIVVILDYCIFYNTQIIEFIVKRPFFFFLSTLSFLLLTVGLWCKYLPLLVWLTSQSSYLTF